MRFSEARFREPVGREEVRVVVQFAGLADTGVERLTVVVAAGATVGFQQVQAAVCERDALLVGAQRDRLDQALLVQVRKGIVPVGGLVAGLRHVTLWHDAERADGGQRTAFLAVEFVDAVSVQDSFALVAKRKIKVVQ